MKEGSDFFTVSGQPVNSFSGASSFNTDSLKLDNSPFVLYAISTHSSGTPTITIQFSDDDLTWFTYKDQSDILISETFFDGEFLPRYIRISYTANSSNGNVTFKTASL